MSRQGTLEHKSNNYVNRKGRSPEIWGFSYHQNESDPSCTD